MRRFMCIYNSVLIWEVVAYCNALIQEGYRSHIWRIFTWGLWRIMGEWLLMRLHMLWMMNSQECCTSKWSFSPVIRVRIRSTVLEQKLVRQVFIFINKRKYAKILYLYFVIELPCKWGVCVFWICCRKASCIFVMNVNCVKYSGLGFDSYVYT